MKFLDIIRPRGAQPVTPDEQRLAAVVDDILHNAPRHEHASWYSTWLAIRRLPEVER